MSALDEIQEEILAGRDKDDNNDINIFTELGLILGRFTLIMIYALIFYFGLAFLFTYPDNNWGAMRGFILISSFILSVISVFLLGGRGAIASSLYVASAYRTAWTGKRMEQGAFNTFRDFAFGIKWDTIMFYGSAIIFLCIYFLT